MRYAISYGNSTTGYSGAMVRVGPRGGVTIEEHHGNGRRVARRAIADAVKCYLLGEPHHIITTSGDILSMRLEVVR